MKRILSFATAFAAVALLSFGIGWFQQHSRATIAEDSSARCATSLESAGLTNARWQGLIDLYRARLELARANYGNAGDVLAKSRTAFSGDAGVLAAIDKAGDAMKKQDPASADLVQQAITAAEAKTH